MFTFSLWIRNPYGTRVAFEKDNLPQTLGEVLSREGMRQLRIAETEKYAHVTYFFNGGREQPFDGEDRILVDSPRDVPTYDLKPAMSALEVTDRLTDAWNSGMYDFLVCNLANPVTVMAPTRMPMAAHSGMTMTMPSAVPSRTSRNRLPVRRVEGESAVHTISAPRV